jgi:uridine phosphorylase
MQKREFPILEFDETRKAIMEPGQYADPADVPEHIVLCFFHDVVTQVAKNRKAIVAATLKSEMGIHPLFEIEVDGNRLGFMQPGVGAPMSAFLLEELIHIGGKEFIVCGGAGAIVKIPVGHIMVPTSAVRDEGTSYHYLPPSREVAPNTEGLAAITQVLDQHNRPYKLAKTWTNDGFYRETADKVELRRSEGCEVVEMEASALFAVAEFRGVTLAQLLYAADDVSSEEWDSRDWQKQVSVREGLFWLAVEACLTL